MSRFKQWARAAGLLALAVIVFPQQALSQRSGVEVWSANCGRCHELQPPNRYSAKDWSSLVTHMAITARLTGAESAAIREFLIGGARMVGGEDDAAAPAPASAVHTVAAVSQGNPEAIYTQHCAPCHGEGAKGDGPAAVAFNPKPADLSVPEFWAERTATDIEAVIVSGKGVMPPLGQAIDTSTRRALIAYLRQTYGGGTEPLAKKAGGSIP